MLLLNTKDILDAALSLTPDNSSAFRAKAVGWLNEIVRDILNQPRQWEMLKTSTTLPIAANKITLPANFGEVRSIQIGSLYFLTPDEQLTEEEAFAVIQAGGGDTLGFTITDTEITFVPGATGSAILSYEKGVATPYADDVATIFPDAFSNLLIQGVRKLAYQSDVDDMYGPSVKLYDREMKVAKDYDNRMKPMPGYGSRFLRGRK